MEGGLGLMNNKGTSVTWVHLTNYSPPSCHMTGKAKRSKASVIPENMKLFLLSGPTMAEGELYIFQCGGNHLHLNPLSPFARPPCRSLPSHGSPSHHHS